MLPLSRQAAHASFQLCFAPLPSMAPSVLNPRDFLGTLCGKLICLSVVSPLQLLRLLLCLIP